MKSTAFTLAQARLHGVDARRLTYDDVVPLGAGVHAEIRLVEQTPPDRHHILVARALVSERSEVWISDTTAAQMRGLALPPRLAEDHRVHLSQRPSPDTRAQHASVVGHRRAVRDQDVVELDGVTVSSPARNWLELADRCSHRELVILGDQLVRTPYARYEARTDPHTTLLQLHETVDAMRGVRGRRVAQTALRDVRVGSDSPTETLLRLALIDAGLPEPELQVPANPDGLFSPRADLGYPQWKVAIQYEGETHYTPEQHKRDQRRDTTFRAEGWDIVYVNSDDLRTGFQAVLRQLVKLLRRKGALL